MAITILNRKVVNQPVTDVSDLTDENNLLAGGGGGGVSSWNDLTDKPTIPTDVSQLTDAQGLLGASSWTDLSDKPTLVTSYTQLTDKPTIPTDVSQLTDTGNILSGGAVTDYNNLLNKPVIPSDISDLTDAQGLLGQTGVSSWADLTDKPVIPEDVSQLTDTQGLLGAASWNELTDKPTLVTSYTQLTDKPTIPSDIADLTDNNNTLDQYALSSQLAAYALNSAVPADIAQLTDASGLLQDQKLTWVIDESKSTLTAQSYNGDKVYNIRSAQVVDGKLELVYSHYSPDFTTPVSSYLNWDQPLSSIDVTVENPTDFTSVFTYQVDMVESPSTTSFFRDPGIVSTWGPSYTALPIRANTAGQNVVYHFAKNPTTNKFAGPDHTQLIGKEGGSYEVIFKAKGTDIVNDNLTDAQLVAEGKNIYNYPSNNGPFRGYQVTWRTPETTLTIGSLSGKTFLETYEEIDYTVSTSNITNLSNVTYTITQLNADLTNATGSGTAVFNPPLFKGIATAGEFTCLISYNRPATVCGTAYSAQDILIQNPPVIFNYPVFYQLNNSTQYPPLKADIVNLNAFTTATVVPDINSTGHTFSGIVTNNGATPKTMWFAVYSETTQPTVFKTGVNAGFLSDVSVITGKTVALSPSPKPAGYVDAVYNFYGIVLQPGDTYVSIT